MLRIISAEFPSIDQAEFAVRKIKEKVDTIDKVIINPNQNFTNQFNPFGHTPPYAATNVNFFGTQQFNNQPYPVFYDTVDIIRAENIPNETQLNRSVTLEIHCKNENLDITSNIITSFGGLNIKKK